MLAVLLIHPFVIIYASYITPGLRLTFCGTYAGHAGTEGQSGLPYFPGYSRTGYQFYTRSAAHLAETGPDLYHFSAAIAV
ncbi:hypothetical protein D3C86_1655760 [compost metagenome]